MTDSEIVKGLECCTAKPRALCKKCPYFLGNGKCKLAALQRDALTLAKDQQAEIERLTETLNATIEGQKTLQRYIAVARAEAVKEFADRLLGKAKSTRERFLLERMIATVTRELIGEDRGKEDLPGTDLSADIVASVLRHCASGRCNDCMLYDANDEDCSCSKTLKIRAAELLEKPSTVTPQQDAITGGK